MSESTATKSTEPSEETFWQRYSAHHEAPLSGIMSLAIHLLAIPLLLLVGWLIVKLGLAEDTRPLDNGVAQWAVGGGSPGGTDKPGTDPKKDAEIGPVKDSERVPLRLDPDEPKRLDPAKIPPLKADFPDDERIPQWINDPTLNLEGYIKLPDDKRGPLRKAAQSGDGGTGPDRGPDRGRLGTRVPRSIRWHITFNTRNGTDYARQLNGLGAIVALPTREKGKFLVIRDLTQRPAQPKEEDVSRLDRIFWIDDNRESVYSLLHDGLGLKEFPESFAALFPRDLEAHLLQIELDHQQKLTGKRDENLIHETKFTVVNQGNKYDVKVASQKYFK